MFDVAKKTRIPAMLVSLGLAVGLAAGPIQAESHKGPFLSSPFGEGIKTGYGECWNSMGGSLDAANCVEHTPEPADGDADGDGVPDSRDKCPGTPAGAKVDADGCEIVPDVSIRVTADHFAFDSATLRPGMETALDDVATKINTSKGNELLEIIGHTDSTGTEAYNQGLSERRAQAAADYLAGRGVSASRMTVRGMGESSPVADNGTRDGRAANRRVEILTR